MSKLLLVPLDDIVVFPNMNVTLTVEVGDEERVLLVPKHEGEYATVGTVARVTDRVRLPGGAVAVALEGLHRGVAGAAETDTTGRLLVEVEERRDGASTDERTRELEREYRAVVEEILELRGDDGRIQAFIRSIGEPGTLADTSGYSPDLGFEQKVKLLETVDVTERLELALSYQRERLSTMQIRQRIREDVDAGMEKQQREYLLRKQMDSIRKELGEDDASVVEEYRTKIAEADMPEAVREQADKELGRFERMGEQSPESQMIRSYLDWLLAVPWGVTSDEILDPIHTREVLDADHAGLEDVKDRIVEYIAVAKLRKERGIEADKRAGAILTLIGPPGTGKTSIGESVAKALNREFVRMSLGGVRDEAEIRGHRRTYIGALPGRLVRALRDAKTMNPVILLDEVDKVGADWRGDPSAALLEVLDPAQNSTFRDHYLDVEVDLSQVFFLATANIAETIPGPLLDRMEVIRFDGYTTDEKVAIARGYLWPRQRERAGLQEDEVSVSDEVLETVISEYTREAGVRQLERELGSILRKTATRIVSDEVDAAGGRRSRRRARCPRPAEVLARGRGAHRGPGCRHRARRQHDGRRRAVRRGDLGTGRGSDADGSARRRDEGVGADRPLRRPLAGGCARHRPGDVRPEVPRARACGSDPEGRPERGDHDGDRARVAPQRSPGEAHGRHDRRGDAPGTRPADRRAEAEGARGPCGRTDGRRDPGAQPRRPRRRPRARAGGAHLPPGDVARRGARRGARGDVLEAAPGRLMRCRQCSPVPEEVRRAAGLLERRWTVSILWASSEGASRFNELKQAVGEIPPRTLAQRLVDLEDAGLLERHVIDARPPRVEYVLTARRTPAALGARRARGLRGRTDERGASAAGRRRAPARRGT